MARPHRTADLDGPLQRVSRWLSQDLWRVDLESLRWPRRPLYALLRIFHLAIRGLIQNRATFTASALTLISVLTLVPMLAFAFSLLKGIGVYERLRMQVIQPFLNQQFGDLSQLPESAISLRHTIDNILDLVSNTNVSSLGLVGLVIVVLAVIRMLENVELAFNTIWGVSRSRSILRKIADYITIAVVSPFLIVLGMTLESATRHSAMIEFLERSQLLGGLVDSLFGLTPLIALWLGFTLLYLTLPNIQPKIISAMLGGLVCAICFQAVQIAHIKFQVGVAHYNAIYSSFAAFPIFLVWIYLSWITVMVGAEFAHAHEAVDKHRDMVLIQTEGDAREDVVALQVMMRIGRAFRDGTNPWTHSALSLDLNVPNPQLNRVLSTLEEAGIVSVVDSPKGGISYVPSRDLSTIRISDIVVALRHREGAVTTEASEKIEVKSLERFYDEIEDVAGNKTLEDMING